MMLNHPPQTQEVSHEEGISSWFFCLPRSRADQKAHDRGLTQESFLSWAVVGINATVPELVNGLALGVSGLVPLRVRPPPVAPIIANYDYILYMSEDTENKKKRKHGPEPERVKTDKPWEDAVKDALKKKRPPDGWPDEKEK